MSDINKLVSTILQEGQLADNITSFVSKYQNGTPAPSSTPSQPANFQQAGTQMLKNAGSAIGNAASSVWGGVKNLFSGGGAKFVTNDQAAQFRQNFSNLRAHQLATGQTKIGAGRS